MATFDCLVDTQAMAESVNGVSHHLTATTAAVTAMQAAVIKTETDAANHICKNVDRGFYNLIRSQLSTKMAKHFTELNAKLLLLVEFAKALGNTQKRMEDDVNRLRREYYKTFHSLDKALANRVRELDRSAMELAEMRKNLITGKMLRDVSNVICMEKDANNTAQMALSARIKSKTSRALSFVGKNVIENETYKNQISTVLENQAIQGQYLEYMPVIYVREQSMVMRDASAVQFYFPDCLSKSVQDKMQTSVSQYAEQINSNMNSEQEIYEIRKEFYNLVANSGMTEREVNMLTALFENGGCR